MLHPPSPPYALSTPPFRFPALAALAGGLALGGGREAALAALLVARLAAGALPPTALSRALRARRAAAARRWLGATCPDARIRAACIALADATAGDEPEPVARTLARLIELVTPVLDQQAHSELTSLGRTFAS